MHACEGLLVPSRKMPVDLPEGVPTVRTCMLPAIFFLQTHEGSDPTRRALISQGPGRERVARRCSHGHHMPVSRRRSIGARPGLVLRPN